MTGSGSEDFDAFYVAAVHRVVVYVYAVCGDRAEAQDIAQEAFARAWQHWARVNGYDDPEAWVRMVAWRLAAGGESLAGVEAAAGGAGAARAAAGGERESVAGSGGGGRGVAAAAAGAAAGVRDPSTTVAASKQ